MSRLYYFGCCLALVSLTLSDHNTNEVNVPSAVLSPSDVSEVVTFNVDANGNDMTLQLNCSGVGNLTWYRGDPAVAINESYTSQLDDNILLLTISPVVNNIDASTNGIPYFCVASNSLGTARSRTVLVKYAFFQGFANVTTDIDVRLGQAVAISCGVLGASPPPEYVWLKNNQSIDTTANTAKIRTLDDGATLVIYTLDADDVSAEYKCGVTNARMFDTEISPIVFKLNQTSTFTNGFMSYRPPKSTTITSDQDATGIVFYYIGATNGATRVFGSGALDFDDSTLSGMYDQQPVTVTNLFMRLLQNDDPIFASRVDFTLTVIDPLVVIDRPSSISLTYHRFSNESINFTCTADGTGTKLRWYHNTDELMVDSTTLKLDRLSVGDSGVYQCFWEDSADGTFASDNWALTVQQPVPPNSFTITSTGDVFGTNRTIVEPGSRLSLTLVFVADTLPSVTWFRTDSETDIGTILSDDGAYNITDPVESGDNMFTAILTVLSVNADTSGYYHAVIDDSRTPPIRSPTWFVSEQVPVQIVSFSLSPHNCLLRGIVNQVQCVVTGLPEPTITFERNTDTILCLDNRTCQITTDVERMVTTSNLTFFNASPTDEGIYMCTAYNSKELMPVEQQLEVDYSSSDTLAFCTNPIITTSSNNIELGEGETGTLSCTVSSEPMSHLQWKWYKENVLVTEVRDRIDISFEDGRLELTISNLLMNDTGFYTCFFNNPAIPANIDSTVNLMVTSSVLPCGSQGSSIILMLSTAVVILCILSVVLIIIIVILSYKLIQKNKTIVSCKRNEIKMMPLKIEQNVSYVSSTGNRKENNAIIYDHIHDHDCVTET